MSLRSSLKTYDSQIYRGFLSKRCKSYHIIFLCLEEMNKKSHMSMVEEGYEIKTFMKRGPQSEHFGGLCGNGLAIGEDKIEPSGDSTYMSSGTILSFWTPVNA